LSKFYSASCLSW